TLWESKVPLAVTVCGKGSLLTQITVSPRLTVSLSGSYFTPSITTVWVDAAAAVPIAAPPPNTNASAQASAACDGPHSLLGPLCPKLRLDRLGMVEVRYECRPHLDDQRLQLLVLGVGDERRVDRIEHRLMVGDFVSDVGLVEFGALEAI